MDEDQKRAAARERTRRYRERLKQDPLRLAAATERTRELRKARYRANRDLYLERQRAYTERNRALVYARNREYFLKNRERIRAQQHEAYVRDLEVNRARDRERGRKRYAADPQKHSDYMKKWRAANPDRARGYVRLAGHRRRAAAGGDHIRVEDWQALLKKHKDRCGYCGEKAALIEADHRIPLSRGGRNTIANILPACRSCNRRKRAKTEVEFRAWLANEAKAAATQSGEVTRAKGKAKVKPAV